MTNGLVPAWQKQQHPDVETANGVEDTPGRARARNRQSPAPLRFLAILLTLTTVFLALGLATPSGASASSAEIATDALRLRDAPGTWGDVLTVMTWGESIEVIDGPTEDGWYKVSYDGMVGWASGDYISFDGVGGTGGGGSERWIDVDRSSGMVTLYEGDNALASYWGAMGYDTTDYGYYATAIGTYYVYEFYRDLAWTEYGQAYITDWVAYDPERNNGFHSYSRDEYGNVLPSGDGPTGGCVALEPWAAAEVYNFAEIGMRVEVHW